VDNVDCGSYAPRMHPCNRSPCVTETETESWPQSPGARFGHGLGPCSFLQDKQDRKRHDEQDDKVFGDGIVKVAYKLTRKVI